MIDLIIAGAVYRIGRHDKRNLVLERRNGFDVKCEWSVCGYFGNSPTALARGLVEIVAAHYSPVEGAALGEQLADLQRVVGDGIERIEAVLKTSAGAEI